MTCRNSHWVLPVAVGIIATFAGKAFSATITNSAPIVIPGPGSSSGTSISVSGLGSFTQSVSVEVSGFSDTHEGDVGLVLVGPTGAALVLQWFCGISAAATNINIGYSDTGGSFLPESPPIASGLYRPTEYDSRPFHDLPFFSSPGPGAAYSSPAPVGTSTLSQLFGGFNPNGTWSLYAIDPVNSNDSGEIAGGWSLTVTSVPEPSSIALAALGFTGLIAWAWRRRRRG